MNRPHILLLPFSWLYGGIVWVRNYCYDHGIFQIQKIEVPVISVGNLTAGGTGKTPFVEYLIRHFLQRQMTVAVVSRGYKRRSRGMVVVSDGSEVRVNANIGGDEPVQIASKFPTVPVIVDERKGRAAHYAALNYGADVVILDDGFQHRSVGRNMDILMIDGRASLRRTPLLPAGMRREPLSSLHRANVLAFTGGSSAKEASNDMKSITDVPQVRVEFTPTRCYSFARRELVRFESAIGKPCIAFCGIANAQSFYETLKKLGMNIVDRLSFPDHHEFGVSELKAIENLWMRRKAEILMTTEKDAVRLRSLELSEARYIENLYYVEITASVIEGEAMLHSFIDAATKRVA